MIMDMYNYYNKNYGQKEIRINLSVREAKLLRFSLKRDPQKSDFSKFMIKELDNYIKMSEDYSFRVPTPDK